MYTQTPHPTNVSGQDNSGHATPNAAITRPVTVGTSVTAPSLIAERDISHVMDCVREGRFGSKDLKALIVTIRSLPKDQAALAAGMKKSLPWFSGSTFHRRRGNEFFKSAWFMVFDLDHVPDIESLKHKALEKLPFLRYAFQSVRDGVKLVAEFASPITKEEDFRTIWKYLALWIGKSLKVEVDSTPDPARVCFLSYDPELLVNPKCRPLVPRKALHEAEAVEALMLVTRTGVADVPVCQGSKSPSTPNNKPLRDFANGDVCGSDFAESPVARDSDPAESPVAQDSDPTESQNGALESSATPATAPRQNAKTPQRQNPVPDDFEKASKVVQKLAQMVIPYSDWYRIGLALYAGFGERGRPLWNLFLANPHYRDTQRDMDAKWNSFRGVREITLATLFEIGGRYGL